MLEIILMLVLAWLLISAALRSVMMDEDDWHDPIAWFIGLAFGMVVTFMTCLFLVGIGFLIGSLDTIHGEKDRDYPLVTLRQQDGINGQFYFLGAGSLRDVQYYFWYRREDDGSITGGKTYRDENVKIYQFSPDSRETPRMTTYKTVHDSEFRAILFGKIIGFSSDSDTKWMPDFHIPIGSIKEGFQL